MTQRGTGSDAGPNACPFVALELDRDRRSERPDYRHRCYAEQVPAPRTIAHQERFCLSPNFSGCPIFQDWAVRAAARPVPLPQGYEGRRAVPDPRMSAGAGAAGAAAAAAASDFSAASAGEQVPPDVPAQPGVPMEPPASEVWPDSMATSAPPDLTAAPYAEEPATEEQLSAFDSPRPTFAALTEPEPEPQGDWGSAANDLQRGDGAPAQDINRSADDDEGVAPVPAFLVGRASRPRPSSSPEARAGREDVVPSWEISDRFGAQSGGEQRESGFFGRLLTIVAVVIILGLGVAAVILVPGLLAGSPVGSTRPSGAVPSRAPTPVVSGIVVLPTAVVPTVAPASVEPTAVATPAPSPKLYRIKSGDTLAKIARKNGITVADILAANPQIPDANQIQVGQIIVIPLPPPAPG